MPYKIQITAPVNRAATIASKVVASTDKREFFGFRNRKHDLPLIQVPIELPSKSAAVRRMLRAG